MSSYLFQSVVPYNDNISIHQPTVEEVLTSDEYKKSSQIVCMSVRAMFSGIPRHVDEIEEKYPTTFDMVFSEEMSHMLEEMFKVESLSEVIINSLAYWTHTYPQDYKILHNSQKIVNESKEWIIDREEFEKFQKVVRAITCYAPNEDLIAPKGISSSSDRRIEIFENVYKGRLRNQQKINSSLERSIIIAQISDGYIPIEEIKKMNIYHFNKLSEAIAEKDRYRIEWDVYVSSKFMPTTGKLSVPESWRKAFKI